MTTTIDLKRTYRDHYTATARPAIVDVPARPCLMIDGSGDPNTSQEYVDAISSLYPIAYGLRKALAGVTGIAYTVMPLEGLWWVDDMRDFDPDDKSNWKWTAFICQPDAVTPEMVAEVIDGVTTVKQLASGHLARLEQFGDGLSAQVLYRGPYSDEGPTIADLHGFVASTGHRLHGKHHEIYLSDARRTDPAKLRTIIRQPMTP
jgi:hypothetical protein